MTRRTRIRLVAGMLAIVALGGLALLDRAARHCLEAGGNFAATRWTCHPRPAIILQRGIERS